ncbi:SLC13 family permease [Anaeromyxobacter dehalogenans]|uniref:TrkA-C n=1 Tax=Anaeromyxobacter dehalogenans (strain 2CP-C) TaxID=290397 RepID=Q2IF46_ANADE|nr:SLC13 family permease [Anaeromyxobacter dehalogenans]ABC83201.1 TrkA-C [Anaeromyxobacter dehalogenans 2CP-C]
MAAALVLGTVLLALVLFWTEWVPVEVTSLLVICVLAATGVLTPRQAFSGFSDDTVIFIFTLLAMTQGLAATGVVKAVGERLTVLGRFGPTPFLVALLVTVAAFSSFVSNTVTAAAFLPVAVSGAERVGMPKREVLMPMAYASMLGGTVLLFGTSTNLVMSAAMARSGLGRIGVTELAPLGLPIAVLGIALVVLVARPLLRRGERPAEPEAVPERAYLSEVAVPAGSPHVGQPLSEVAPTLGARPVAVVRDGEPRPAEPGAVLAPDDRVVVEGRREEIVGAAAAPGVALGTGAAAAPPEPAPGAPDAPVVVEASVPPGSRLAGKALAEADLAAQLGLDVLGIHRRPVVQRLTKLQLLAPGRRRGGSIGALPIAAGDLLLLRGSRERVRALADGGLLLVLSGVDAEPLRRRKALLAAAIFLAALGVGTAGRMPMAVAGLAGLLAMIFTGCVDARRALRVDWRVVLLVGSMLALGLAMEESGAGRLVGERLAAAGTLAGPHGVLLALVVLTIVLSAPMSNQAAALVMLPVAIAAAHRLGVDPRPFAIGVTLAGSCSFVTPLEPASMLVYGAGRYRFADFVRVGTPLTLAIVALLTLGVPLVWPFTR